MIRNTKFGKTRLVPIGDQLCDVLKNYLAERHRLRHPVTSDAPFFATVRFPGMKPRFVNEQFRQLCRRVGIHRKDGGRFQPRPNDLRHTFVAHRIEAEYESQQDLQRLLEELPTYLGHVGLASSQRYLNLTPTILAAANQRFSQFALTQVRQACQKIGDVKIFSG